MPSSTHYSSTIAFLYICRFTSILLVLQQRPQVTAFISSSHFRTTLDRIHFDSDIPSPSATTTTTIKPTMSLSATTRENPMEMTDEEKYLFDLNGFIVVRGVLTPEEVQQANEAIDRHAQYAIERSDSELRNASPDTPLYGTGPGRKDLGGVLEWDDGDATVFQQILAHPKLLPFFHSILGKGYRMDHLPFVISQIKGAEGFSLHGGTIDCGSGIYNPHLAYHYNHGTIHCALLGCNVMLSDHNSGDGGFCVVPGSHKSNLKMPNKMVDGLDHSEFIIQPVTKAGDVVLFSEGTVHGAKAWTADHERRACLYRFAPATNAYGRSYFGHDSENNTNDEKDQTTIHSGWPSKMYRGLTEAQRAVLEPPYANRLDRPNILEHGKIELTTRNERKKLHDQQVFGTKYF